MAVLSGMLVVWYGNYLLWRSSLNDKECLLNDLKGIQRYIKEDILFSLAPEERFDASVQEQPGIFDSTDMDIDVDSHGTEVEFRSTGLCSTPDTWQALLQNASWGSSCPRLLEARLVM